MNRFQPHGREFSDEIYRDDRLAGAWTALDKESDLPRVLARRADLVHDRVEGDLLFIQKHECRLVPDDTRDVVEQSLVRLERADSDAIEDRAVIWSGDSLV